MTDQTKQALEQFILQIIDAAKNGATWTAEQTPLLVQEWLRWQAVEAGVWSIVAAIVFGALAYGSYFCWRKKNENPREDWEIGGTLFGVFACGALVPLVVCSLTVLKVLIAPRVVVFEQFMRLMQ